MIFVWFPHVISENKWFFDSQDSTAIMNKFPRSITNCSITLYLLEIDGIVVTPTSKSENKLTPSSPIFYEKLYFDLYIRILKLFNRTIVIYNTITENSNSIDSTNRIYINTSNIHCLIEKEMSKGVSSNRWKNRTEYLREPCTLLVHILDTWVTLLDV